MKQEITLHDKTFVPFIPYEKIIEAIDKVAGKINEDYKGSEVPPVLLCILNGSIMFTGELMKRLDFDCELVSMKVSSYDGTESTGKIRQVMGLTGSLKGKRVLIIEDIVDTGNTIDSLVSIARGEGASEVKICSMLLKPDVYKKTIPINYVAMSIPNDFIVGFGLDYNNLGRNYKDIYVLKPEK